MGRINSYECSKCGDKGDIWLGVGMTYPLLCREIKQAAQEGKCGKRLQKVISENPEGVMDCTYEVYVCKCGGWKNAPRMDYFVVENDPEFDPGCYYQPWEKLGGRPLYQARRMCPRCGKKMRPLKRTPRSLTCNKCGGRLELMLDVSWFD